MGDSYMTLAARVERLHRGIEDEHGPGILAFVAVVCNNCGRRVEASSVPALLPAIEGWTLGDFGQDQDYCPECRC